MITIHQQFIALQKAAHRRGQERDRSIQRAVAYEALSDAIAALPLDSLAGDAALGHSEALEVEDDPTLPACNEAVDKMFCILRAGHDGPHVTGCD